jgi:hypothetical protein
MADIAVAAEPKTELESLREEVAFLKSCGIIEVAVRNPSVAEYMKHWEERAEKAEAELGNVTATRALLRLFHTVYGDYVDDVWGRDYGYVAEALGVTLDELHRAAYDKSYEQFLDNIGLLQAKRPA